MTILQENFAEDMPDLYQILGLSRDVGQDPDCQKIIKKAYIKKVSLCHPDKYPGRKDMEEYFELITTAYNVLSNEKERNEYNLRLSIEKKEDTFTALMDGFKKYIDEQKNKDDDKEISRCGPSTKDPSQNCIFINDCCPLNRIPNYDSISVSRHRPFEDISEELDKKHGYDPNSFKIINEKDTKAILDEMRNKRISQDGVIQPSRIFDEGEKFDIEKFNEAFDLVHTKVDKLKGNKKEDQSLMKVDPLPAPWDNNNRIIVFGDVNDFNSLYKDDDCNSKYYSTIEEETPPSKTLTKEEVKNLKGAHYVKHHNDKESNYYKNIKIKLNERKTMEKLNNMTTPKIDPRFS
jgi:curved DNA-binding protein CbpA